MSFLKAEWRKLVLVNYVIEPELLLPYLPAGVEIDLWNGNCYVSLVGFMFKNTRVLGLPIPGHIDFEEVNLRFYVKRTVDGEIRRGVVFIRELVPRHAITFVANTLYHEHYATVPMRHEWLSHERQQEISYSWKVKSEWQELRITASSQGEDLVPGSKEEFITEHYWGYTKISGSRTTEYEVRHPSWKVYAVNDLDLKVDYGQTYGPEFSFLDKAEVDSTMLAEGSAITVESKTELKV